MATKTIKQMNADAKALLLEAKSLYDKGDDATLEERQLIVTKTTEAEEIVKQLDTLGTGEALKTINRIENTIATFEKVDRPALGGDGFGTDPRGRVHQVKTAGQEFIESEGYLGWLKTVCPNGRAPDRLTIPSPAVEVKTLYTEAVDRTAGGPLLGQVDRRPEVVGNPWAKMLVLRQLITNLTTSSDVVEVVRELAPTNAAAAVAEATATTGSSGLKPESAMTWEVIQSTVQTIAHWIPATTRIVADASRLRGEIDAFLRSGVDQGLEAEILNGNGSSPHFLGINNTTGILAQAFVTDLLKTTRKARTNLRLNGRVLPTAYLFNPLDWETLDLTQDQEARYFFGGPTVLGVPRVWGVPVVESEFQAQGTGLLGNFADAVIYDREQTAITIGTVNDDFIRNMVRVLAEMRAAFHVRRPKSFCQIAMA